MSRTRPLPIPLFWIVAAIGTAAPWALLHWGPSISAAPGIEGQTCRVASIYDGDTLRAECDGEKVKVRLHCIDTPEMQQKPWGRESRDHLRAMTPKTITLVQHDRDRYGRIVGEVYAGDRSLNLAMVEGGQAAVYRRYCSDRRFTAAEERARAAGLGIWAKPGDHQRPWEWRKRAK